MARDLDCTLLLDEFYSHYVWTGAPGRLPVESAARYVEDVDEDPVVIFDGLTKNWRYPGWRVTWTLGPREVIEAVASAGSFLDGGGSRPLQRAAVPLLSEEHVAAETLAIHRAFAEKRTVMLEAPRAAWASASTARRTAPSTCGGRVARLPSHRRRDELLPRGAERKVICVPGEFFDVNPGKRRSGPRSRFRRYVRFSFGPSRECLGPALDRLEGLIRDHTG